NAGYENQRFGNVAGARETVGSSVVQKSGIQCYNCKEHGHVARECQKPKRAKDAAYHREKMLLSHYMYMAKLQQVSPDAVDSGPIFDKEPEQKVQTDDHYDVFAIELDMNYDSEQIDQNDKDADLTKERELLASLIEKLKCEIDESKNPDMSSASSAVTYTSVYTDSEPGRVFWGADEELSNGGSPRVIVYEYDGIPMLPDGDEHEPMFIQLHDPDFVPKPIYPEYIPLEDEHILLAEEQPLPPIVSPTAESPGYVAELDPEEDPDEYEDDETKDGPVEYPMDGGDEGDDDNGDSFRDNTDDEDKDEEDEEEEEEHLASADSATVIPTDELVSPPEGTEPAATSFPLEAEVKRLLAMPSPSPSPLTSLSPPSAGERLARCTTPAELPSPPLPPPLHMPPPIDRRDEILEIEVPPRKRLCLSTLGSRYKVGESSTARPTEGQWIDYGFVSTLDAEARRRGIGEVGYGIRDTWIDPAETVSEIAPMTVREVNARVAKLAELHEHDTHDLYALLEDVEDSRTRTEGVVGLTRWIEKMESVFQISGCATENQVKEYQEEDKIGSKLDKNGKRGKAEKS
nr:hypothetical protein [Tanacetum cinerariifolium]